MDYANERYVRLYTRDTATWLLLGWEARCVWPLLLRKFDRAGVIDFPPRVGVARSVSRVVDVPIEIVEPALRELADIAGWIEVRADTIVAPRFIPAQETAASPTERQRRRRERVEAARSICEPANIDVTPGHAVSRAVTNVTPSLAVPNQTEPNQNIGARDARESMSGSESGQDSPSTLDLVTEEDVPSMASEVLRILREAVCDVTGKAGGPRDCPGNRKLIQAATRREGASLEDWRQVIRAQAESVRHDRAAWQWLCLSTICRPNNFARLRDAPPAAKSPRGPIDPRTQDHTKDPGF